MLIVDANVLVSAVVGRSRALIRATAERGIELLATDAALVENRRVLKKLGLAQAEVDAEMDDYATFVRLLSYDVYTPLE